MEGSKICVCTDGDASLGKENLGRERAHIHIDTVVTGHSRKALQRPWSQAEWQRFTFNLNSGPLALMGSPTGTPSIVRLFIHS